MFDLHIHSDHSSDGVLSPYEILTIVRSRGISMFSITDHNSVASADVMKWYKGKYGNKTLYVNGVELSLYHKDREVHVLSYAYDASCPIMAGVLEIYQRNRVLQSELRVEKLQDLGFCLDYKEVMKAAGGKLPSGVTFLKVLAKYSENREMLEDYLLGEKSGSPYTNFYFDYFTKGGPAYVDVPLLDFDDTVARLKNRSLLVLAHPGLYKDKDIIEVTGNGVEGIEVYSSYHSPEQTAHFKRFAEENDLLVLAGSDFHGDRIKPGIAIAGHGCTDPKVAEKFIERIKSFEKGCFFI
jgi:predicted metal-dependent phosphoesterase TrpH